jgi:microsomal dipeptidase-like Zn-dependent dipeptidase
MFCTAVVMAAAVAMTSETGAGQQPAAADQGLETKARAIHDRVITLDTHVDIGVNNFTAECNYTQDTATQVNLPKMIKGGLDTVFFIVYVGQNRSADAFTKPAFDRAYADASAKFDAIHRFTREIAADKIGLALTSDDVRRLNKEGKKIAMIGVENGYPLGDETTALARVREFHQRGARYLSLAHNGHSQLADSNTGEATNEWLHKGLSPLGKQVIAELNRVGIMVDISHPSKDANLQAMALSKVPVIASHSGARAVQNHSRNLDDEQLLALKKNGGVAQAVALAGYVKENQPSAERTAALAKLADEFKVPANAVGRGGGGGRGQRDGVRCPSGQQQAAGGAAGAPGVGGQRGGGQRGRGGNPVADLSEAQRAELQKRVDEINTKFPPPARASVQDFVDHIDYIVKKIGIDHVGISSDFDGGGGIDGWNDASETFNVTLELVRRGYTEQQIAKIWSGNLLRVLDQVQKYARSQK